jgi:hypothetical protein
VWKEEHREGVILYLSEDVVRGALLWNVWDRVDWARQLIREGKPMTTAEREKVVAEAVRASPEP